jgi:hypothetical protein
MVRPPAKRAIEAPVVLASAPAETSKAPILRDDSQDAVPITSAPRPTGARPDQLMQVASYEVPVRQQQATTKPAAPKSTVAKPDPRPQSSTKSGSKTQLATSGPKHAMADPLAPLPAAKSSAKARAPGSSGKPATSTIKDNGSAQ